MQDRTGRTTTVTPCSTTHATATLPRRATSQPLLGSPSETSAVPVFAPMSPGRSASTRAVPSVTVARISARSRVTTDDGSGFVEVVSLPPGTILG
ncbi:hypothetical protein AMK22_04470 [Streptomyces sp. CB01580]|nr:hypothetical protein AMK22_04470 [Streptomyces sp. CB01580]